MIAYWNGQNHAELWLLEKRIRRIFKNRGLKKIGKAEGRTAKILRMESVDGKLILQGAEEGVEGVRDGLGWSMTVSEDTGRTVLTGSGDEVGFVIFGACTPQ